MRASRLWITLVLLALVASLLAPGWAGLRSASAQAGCESAPPPRLVPGERGAVSFTDGQPLNVRGSASRSSPVIGRLVEGAEFDVVEGPVCADGLYWWHIKTPDIAGVAAEGADGVYFVEPVPGAWPTPSHEAGPPPLTTGGPFTAWDWAALVADSWLKDAPDPLALQLPPSYQGDLPALPVDLNAVQFVDDAGLNAAQLALLAQNGFVVVPAGLKQFHEAYAETENWWTVPLDYDWQSDEPAGIGHAYFVTTDAMLHALHFIFDNLLTDLEKQRFVDLTGHTVLLPTLQAAHAQATEAAGTPLEGAARAAELYLAVGLELYAPGEAAAIVGPELAAEAQSVAALALAGEGQVEIPFLSGYREDFSQYRPRGHYAGDEALERYFRGTMWLSRITFLENDPQQLRVALMLLRALNNAPGALAGWNALHDTLSFLIGPSDDPGPREYLPLAEASFGAGLPLDALADAGRMEAFQASLVSLPGPRVNGLIVPDDTTAEELEEDTRGFRFMGQRFTFDGYIMQQVMYPYVGTREMPRLLPLGLDVAAALGSETAYNLAIDAGAGDFLNYDAQILSLAAQIDALSQDNWRENTYGAWLWTLRPLWDRTGANPYPPLMQTDAWLRKDLQTGLASWTELKHDTVLYVKQPTGFGGGGLPLTSFGYVEPNPLVFARIAVVAAITYQGLEAQGFSVPAGEHFEDTVLTTLDALRTFGAQSARLAEIARKELAGEPLSEDDFWMILGFHNDLYVLLYTLWQGEGEPDPVALVTDVASNPSVGTALQEAVGEVDYIYVVVTLPDGSLQLTRGGVFSYYEFLHDINDRMTDGEWRAQVASGDLPPRPAWTSAFFSE
ncbi:MAG: DUF3160 domain-containing protein [Anaerolineae bacterium]|nr:DUF3160 domain-containing protein [Anaerolineae bacterium]